MISNKNFFIYDYQGMKLLLDDRSLVDRTILTEGYWEKAEIDYFSALWPRESGKRKLFFDLGAYFGLYSLHAWASKLFDEIHAFEADAYNFAQLQAQIFINEAMDIKAYNLAVSDHVGTVRISSSLEYQVNRGMTFISDTGRSEVECTALDMMFPDIKDSLVYAKIDVEGHELSALRGMRNIIKNNHVLLKVEAIKQDNGFISVRENRYNFIDEYGLSMLHEINSDIFATNMPDFT